MKFVVRKKKNKKYLYILKKIKTMEKKLNNLLGLEEFSCDKVCKKAKPTKHTEVAKDILAESNDYPKDWSKDVNEKPKKKDVISNSNLHNLISLDDFGKSDLPKNDQKHSKRTETGKDIVNEKKVRIDEDEDEDEDNVKVKSDCKGGKKCKPYDDDDRTKKFKKIKK
jgi:hypothetical protein